jgi:hypothetical protein
MYSTGKQGYQPKATTNLPLGFRPAIPLMDAPGKPGHDSEASGEGTTFPTAPYCSPSPRPHRHTLRCPSAGTSRSSPSSPLARPPDKVDAHVRASSHRRQFEAELLQRIGKVGSLRRVENFDSDKAAFGVVIDNDTVRHLLAVLDRAIGQVEIDGVRGMVDSQMQDGIPPSWPGMSQPSTS